MALSRVRLRLGVWFAAAVLVAVGTIDAAAYAYLRRDANRRLDRDVRDAASAMLRAVNNERQDTRKPMGAAAHDALAEWPNRLDGFAVYVRDSLVATSGPSWLRAALASVRAGRGVRHLPRGDGGAGNAHTATASAGDLTIVSARSTGPVHQFEETLQGWLFVSVPATALLALFAGYLLAGRALRPVEVMTDAIAAMEPQDLDRRLTVREPPDELDRLAAQFNGLLARLSAQRARNRAFIQQAAHQLRTPLTVVRGESALGLERPRDAAQYRDTLARVRRAADQMSHRVDELFVLADAEAGVRPALTDAVELDGVALECTDLMRGRAQAERRALELRRVEPARARGNAVLVREALIELLANAITYGAADGTVGVSAYRENGEARLEVVSGGAPWSPPAPSGEGDADSSHGLGLSIVRWIADVHGGELRHAYRDGANVFTLAWPAGP